MRLSAADLDKRRKNAQPVIKFRFCRANKCQSELTFPSLYKNVNNKCSAHGN